MIVVNLFGGPGCGKTGTAHGVMSILKKQGWNCEYVPEYAKDIVYEDTHHDKPLPQGFLSGRLANQRHIFAEQHRRLFRLYGKVDVVVTDGPLFNSIVYSGKGEEHKFFHSDVINEFSRYQNVNLLLRRETKYVQAGRYQDENGAKEVDAEVVRCFDYFKVPYEEIGLDSEQYIVSLIHSAYASNNMKEFFKEK